MWGSRGDTILPRGTPLSHLIFKTPGSCFYRQNTSRREKFTDLVRVPAARRRQSRAVKQGPGSQPGRPPPFALRKAPLPSRWPWASEACLLYDLPILQMRRLSPEPRGGGRGE